MPKSLMHDHAGDIRRTDAVVLPWNDRLAVQELQNDLRAFLDIRIDLRENLRTAQIGVCPKIRLELLPFCRDKKQYSCHPHHILLHHAVSRGLVS